MPDHDSAKQPTTGFRVSLAITVLVLVVAIVLFARWVLLMVL
jgi:hypothetical protein